ncbi:hypothetical protein BCR42DRAFT_405743 [Absidia repens]|uniref:Succinate dehydrogenase assembly factor 3 n=1 Tax=Absidia repens TaxID=90262 RepID=A0A1X2ITY4_9FUNG|nr:hypothetical protein BCR42DRAFT_405743 [Absidia repens]
MTRAARRAAQEAKVLLAPIPLYRQILRVHRNLPPAMRSMGDDYVKSEFRRHKSIDNPVHIIGFVSQWQEYLELLKSQTEPNHGTDSPAPVEDSLVRSFNTPKDGWGKRIDGSLLDKLSDEQLGQLYELRTEVKKSVNGDDHQK